MELRKKIESLCVTWEVELGTGALEQIEKLCKSPLTAADPRCLTDDEAKGCKYTDPENYRVIVAKGPFGERYCLLQRRSRSTKNTRVFFLLLKVFTGREWRKRHGSKGQECSADGLRVGLVDGYDLGNGGRHIRAHNVDDREFDHQFND